MAEFSRRDMLGAAGGMAAAATGTETFGQGQPSFGPTPAPLAGAELPSFRFQLGAVTAKTWKAVGRKRQLWCSSRSHKRSPEC